MNELFVNIKVDREERPDIDAIYMSAVQAMTGQGGWPMTMFLTPEGVPYHGGTYYPPTDRHGMPSFVRVLRSVAEAYRTRRGDVLDTAERVRGLYAGAQQAAVSAGELTPCAARSRGTRHRRSATTRATAASRARRNFRRRWRSTFCSGTGDDAGSRRSSRSCATRS